MKKAIGICLILLGAAIFYLCGYGFCRFMATSKEKTIASFAKKDQDANFVFKEGIDNHIQNGRLKTGLLTLMGLGIALGGFALYRKSASVR